MEGALEHWLNETSFLHKLVLCVAEWYTDERARHFWFSEQDAAPLGSIVSLLEGIV